MPLRKRIYVKVNSDFDATGVLVPRCIIWNDGRAFPIDEVRDFCPAARSGHPGDCYTVLIRGEERFLFFERTDPMYRNRIGRWFVEC